MRVDFEGAMMAVSERERRTGYGEGAECLSRASEPVEMYSDVVY